MADERQKRLMQESLDEALELDARQALQRELDDDPKGSAEFRRLRQVDELLRLAPFERAPKTLALSIMAKLAESLQKPELSHLSGLAMALALAMVTVVMVPLLVGVSLLFLNAIASAEALAGLMQVIGRLLALALAAVESMVHGAQSLLETYPQTPALMIAIVPVLVFWMARLNLSRHSDPDGES